MTTTDNAITCANCLKPGVTRKEIPYSMAMAYEGKTYTVSVPRLSVEQCPNCQEIFLDSDALQAMDRGLRAHVRLLEPARITKYRERLGHTQKEFAGFCRVAPETICRDEKGQRHQSALLDLFMRLYFASPVVRSLAAKFASGDDLSEAMEYSTQQAADNIAYNTAVVVQNKGEYARAVMEAESICPKMADPLNQGQQHT